MYANVTEIFSRAVYTTTPLSLTHEISSKCFRRPVNLLFAFSVVKLKIFSDTIRYDTRCYFNVRSKAGISQLNLPHGNNS